MKTLQFHPTDQRQQVYTESRVLDALLAQDLDVLMACGGKGRCATCHVRIRSGMDKLTPPSERELRTLGFLTNSGAGSRLACQARVLGEGVVVDLPEGTYIEKTDDLLHLLGKRASTDILHPINASVLVRKGKIITRSRIEELEYLNAEVRAIQ